MYLSVLKSGAKPQERLSGGSLHCWGLKASRAASTDGLHNGNLYTVSVHRSKAFNRCSVVFLVIGQIKMNACKTHIRASNGLSAITLN